MPEKLIGTLARTGVSLFESTFSQRVGRSVSTEASSSLEELKRDVHHHLRNFSHYVNVPSNPQVLCFFHYRRYTVGPPPKSPMTLDHRALRAHYTAKQRPRGCAVPLQASAVICNSRSQRSQMSTAARFHRKYSKRLPTAKTIFARTAGQDDTYSLISGQVPTW